MNIFKPLIVCFFLACCMSFAQETTTDVPADESSELTGEGSEFLILTEVALGTGWPGYQLYNINAGFQKDSFGVNLKGSITEAGPYVHLAGRYFLPIPIPVPTFASVGGGFFSDSPVGTVTMGAQIPFGITSPFRATLEAGVALDTGLNGGLEVLPTASLTIGYTFFIETSPPDTSPIAQFNANNDVGPCVPSEPNFGSLKSALDRKIDAELRKAKVKYSGVYRLGSWSYSTTKKSESANSATWEGTWRGSATEVLTGNTTRGEGTFKATFNWTGCSWNVNANLN